MAETLEQYKHRQVYGKLINQHPSRNNYVLNRDGVLYSIDWNTGYTCFVSTCRDYPTQAGKSVKGGYVYGQAFENVN